MMITIVALRFSDIEQKSQDLEFFLFFKEFDLMWMMIILVAHRFSDTSFTFPQTPETTKIAGSRIFLIL